MNQTLHLLTKNDNPSYIPPEATVVLMQDATYLLTHTLKYQNIYVIEDELLAREINGGTATVIDYYQLIALTQQYTKIVTWT